MCIRDSSRPALWCTFDRDQAIIAPTADSAAMYRHILLPTDGSKLALKGARAGIRLAHALGARVTAVYVAPVYMPPIYGEAMIYAVPGGTSPKVWKKQIAALTGKAFAAVEREARKAGVPFAGYSVTDAQPWAGILLSLIH